MTRKRYLPSSPLAPREFVRFDLTDPEQNRAAAVYLKERLRRLARDKEEYPSEFDRLLASNEAWCREAYAEAGLKPREFVPNELYPYKTWYACQISSLAEEIRRVRDRDPDLALGLALLLGELVGEARAHLTHGENAARGIKVVDSARAGHEQTHGTEETKRLRWRAQYAAFEKYRAEGNPISAAELLAAEECGVSPRTIHTARKRTA